MQIISRERTYNREARVYFDHDEELYVVRFYLKGEHQVLADCFYHARNGGKEDALATARTIWNGHVRKAMRKQPTPLL